MLIQTATEVSATTIQLWGAACFGAIIGWYVYFINRYRKEDVQFSDLTTVIGIIGGGAVLNLFPASTDLFGAYGIGLAAGFFGYFFFLIVWVRISENFDVDWFLDGRRKAVSGIVKDESGRQSGTYIPEGTRLSSSGMNTSDEANEGFDD